LADGSLAFCDSEDEADQKVVASWDGLKIGKNSAPNARTSRPKRRTLAGGRVS